MFGRLGLGRFGTRFRVRVSVRVRVRVSVRVSVRVNYFRDSFSILLRQKALFRANYFFHKRVVCYFEKKRAFWRSNIEKESLK